MNAHPPTVSIVTVTFNSAATLHDTLASVAGQTYPYIEHVLIDGGSTDRTVDLIRAAADAAPSRVRWISEPDEGIYDAMNKGAAMASGEVIGMLNSDDFLADSAAITDIVARLQETGADAVYADLVFVDSINTERVERVWRAGTGRLTQGWCPPHPTLYVSAATFREVGPYRTDFTISADYDFMLRLFAEGRRYSVAYLGRVVVKMRHGGASTRNLSANITGFREVQRALKDARVRPAGLVNVLRVVRKFRQLRTPRSRH